MRCGWCRATRTAPSNGTLLHQVGISNYFMRKMHGQTTLKKQSSNPITGLDRPVGFQEVDASRFQDSQHMKVVRLSDLRTGRLIHQEIPGTHFCSRLSRPQGHSAAGRIMSMKNSNDTIGRTIVNTYDILTLDIS